MIYVSWEHEEGKHPLAPSPQLLTRDIRPSLFRNHEIGENVDRSRWRYTVPVPCHGCRHQTQAPPPEFQLIRLPLYKILHCVGLVRLGRLGCLVKLRAEVGSDGTPLGEVSREYRLD